MLSKHSLIDTVYLTMAAFAKASEFYQGYLLLNRVAWEHVADVYLIYDEYAVTE